MHRSLSALAPELWPSGVLVTERALLSSLLSPLLLQMDPEMDQVRETPKTPPIHTQGAIAEKCFVYRALIHSSVILHMCSPWIHAECTAFSSMQQHSTATNCSNPAWIASQLHATEYVTYLLKVSVSLSVKQGTVIQPHRYLEKSSEIVDGTCLVYSKYSIFTVCVWKMISVGSKGLNPSTFSLVRPWAEDPVIVSAFWPTGLWADTWGWFGVAKLAMVVMHQ